MLCRKEFFGLAQVVEEDGCVPLAVFMGTSAENGRRVEGGEDGRKALGLLHFAVLLCDPELWAEQRLRGGGSKADDQVGSHGFKLRIEPRAAGVDLLHAGLFVDAQLAARLPSKMLDRVGDEDLPAIDCD